MTALANVRRRRTALMLAANLLAVVALCGMSYAGVRALQRYEGATKVSVDSIKLPATPVGMLATVDKNDVLTSVTVFVLKAGTQVGGSIVSLPVSADSTPGTGEQRVPLTQVYADGGAEALVLAVESVLSITFDVSQVATAADAEELLQAVVPVKADLPNEVLGNSSGGTITLFGAGEINLSAAQVVQLLNATAEGRVEADRRADIEALWVAVAASVGAGRTVVPDAVATVTSVADLLDRLFAGPTLARGLPASAVVAADNPDSKDVATLDRAEAIFVLASVAPASMSAPSPGLVFRIEAPPGYEERVKFAVRAVLYLGANVQSVYLGGGVHAATRYYIDDPRLVEQAESNNALFGNTETLTPDLPIEGIDVILQLGTDFLTGVGDELPSTTTSTTEPS